MSIESELRNVAQQIATGLQGQLSSLQREQFEAETRYREATAKLDAAKLAMNRLASFTLKIGGHFQCPKCWFADGTQSNIRAIGGGTDRDDFFRCDKGHDYSASSR